MIDVSAEIDQLLKEEATQHAGILRWWLQHYEKPHCLGPGCHNTHKQLRKQIKLKQPDNF